MTDTAIAIPPRQLLEARDRSAPGRVTGKLKVAIDEMVWSGLRRNDAAKLAGMAVHGLREAFRKPHVKAYYRAQLEVLRESERARNIHRLAEIRDAGHNMPAVQAIKALEQLGDEQSGRSSAPATPGLVVVINSGPQPVEASDVGVSWRSDRKGE